jgi:hypothetical protein
MQKVLARFAPQRPFAPPSKYILSVLLAALLNFAAPTFATAQLVEIGKFSSEGTVHLQLPKFHQNFADGTRIIEITVTEYNGNRVVKRKGDAASNGCRIEVAPILKSTGGVIPSAFVAPAGTPVFFGGTFVPVTAFYCRDDHRRCALLKNAVPVGYPPNQSAHCDQTDASDNKCKCHVVPAAGGITIPSVDFCNSYWEQVSSPTIEWVRSHYFQK